MSKTDKIIQKDFIPKWVENTKDLLIEATKSSNEQDLLDYLITFENECKYQRNKYKIAEVNKN
jgi:ABC-type sulfate transport system substrate-binding protein